MASGARQEPQTATELMKAMTRLRARLRSESAPTEMRWTWSQLTTLGRIISEGPATVSELAHAEHRSEEHTSELQSLV